MVFDSRQLFQLSSSLYEVKAVGVSPGRTTDIGDVESEFTVDHSGVWT
jgi:hypothetical protein